jgi:hypothetical protein
VSVRQLEFICNNPLSIEPSPLGLETADGLHRLSLKAIGPNILGGKP